MEDAMHVWGQGVYGKSLYLPFQFYEHKCIKNNVFKNKK